MQHQLKCMPNNDGMGPVHHKYTWATQSASNQPLEPSMHMSPLSLSGVRCVQMSEQTQGHRSVGKVLKLVCHLECLSLQAKCNVVENLPWLSGWLWEQLDGKDVARTVFIRVFTKAMHTMLPQIMVVNKFGWLVVLEQMQHSNLPTITGCYYQVSVLSFSKNWQQWGKSAPKHSLLRTLGCKKQSSK